MIRYLLLLLSLVAVKEMKYLLKVTKLTSKETKRMGQGRLGGDVSELNPHLP